MYFLTYTLMYSHGTTLPVVNLAYPNLIETKEVTNIC